MADSTGQFLLKEKDFVKVVDDEGKELAAVPKHWGSDQLPAGAKKERSSSRSSSSGGGSGQGGPASERKSGEEPKGNASTEEWAAYAREKGAADEDLKDEQGEPLGQKALREKYGAPAS